MIVKEVSVEVHEKRNHPSEYGHYDCAVRMTAEVGPDEGEGNVAFGLVRRCRAHVKDECDRWERTVVEEKAIADLCCKLDSHINRLNWSHNEDELQKRLAEINTLVDGLPEQLQETYRTRIEEAERDAIMEIEQREKERQAMEAAEEITDKEAL